MRKSKLNAEKKQWEILRLRKMTPEQRLKAQARLNVRIKALFNAGLSSQGFSQKQISCLWRQR
jgi:hypothetical protein